MSMRASLFLVLGVACASPPQAVVPAQEPVSVATVVEPAAAAPRDPDADRQDVIDVVRASSSALLEKQDVALFLSYWSTDAVLVRSRQEALGPSDVTLALPQIGAVRRIIVLREEPRTLDVADTRVELEGDRATLRWLATTSVGNARDVFAEEYELIRTEEGWRIDKMRYWPESRTVDGDTAVFGPSWVRNIDDEVETARAGGDERQLLYLLFGAYRFREAHALATDLTSRSGADAWTWSLLGTCALMIGDVEQAEHAFAMAKRLEEPP